jgi:hypothetical protein
MQQEKGGTNSVTGKDAFDSPGEEAKLASDIDDNFENRQYTGSMAKLLILPFSLKRWPNSQNDH